MSGTDRDPFGHVWGIATHVEVLDEDEIERRAAAFLAPSGGSG